MGPGLDQKDVALSIPSLYTTNMIDNNTTFTKNDLLDLAYYEAEEYTKDCGARLFDCLIACIGGQIKTLKALQDHGIADGLTEQECRDRLKEMRENGK